LSEYRLGLWRTGSSGTGWEPSYPATATIHEGRLATYGAPLDPARVDLSNTDDFENFSPTDPDGTVTDTHAISFTLTSSGIQVGRWLASDEKGLMAGSMGQEWILRPSNQGEGITPSNVSAKPTDTNGADNIAAIKVGKAAIFVQRAGHKVMEYQYFYDVDGFRCEDLTQLAEHITVNGIRQTAFQKVPQPILWVVTNTGELMGMTYERTQELVRSGWHRHPIAGVSNADGDPAKVHSIAVIPSPDGTSEDLWMVVQRYINGATVFHVEYMTQLFDSSMDAKDAFFVDGGLTYDNVLNISSISENGTTDRVLVAFASAHSYSNGDTVKLSDIVGLSSLNDSAYLVADGTTSSFTLKDTSSAYLSWDTVSGTSSLSYVSDGFSRKYVSTVSGLGHLQGQSVVALADARVMSGLTVASSAVTLTSAAPGPIHIGLEYESKIKTLRYDRGAIDGTSLGKLQRSANVGVMLERTGIGMQIGRTFDNLIDIPIDDTDLPLFSGIKMQHFEDDYGLDNRICIQHSMPTPSTILAVFPELVTTDG
jgi:hypothetical protein